ncbi:hypothetical protein PtA15_1A745 [Puccinia triticina]|uniref:Uncharacterized protein n=1 Tax=Puccinia triticina TaxID=208348 RepID=A0ABY7C8C7_9BASI|nr:uncharacterized protein PtA15_1A745 [Puccinia triticina]WAQ81404.1 hypothetical protein PtA15_1A745 [Puccinia triticina]WAR52285.1 hypothetical protein PtB15_1B726 [Puccinia triticina]
MGDRPGPAARPCASEHPRGPGNAPGLRGQPLGDRPLSHAGFDRQRRLPETPRRPIPEISGHPPRLSSSFGKAPRPIRDTELFGKTTPAYSERPLPSRSVLWPLLPLEASALSHAGFDRQHSLTKQLGPSGTLRTTTTPAYSE